MLIGIRLPLILHGTGNRRQPERKIEDSLGREIEDNLERKIDDSLEREIEDNLERETEVNLEEETRTIWNGNRPTRLTGVPIGTGPSGYKGSRSEPALTAEKFFIEYIYLKSREKL